MGAPRIHGELAELGIEVAQSTVAKHMARRGAREVAILEDLSAQPFGRHRRVDSCRAAVGFRLLFVWVILKHQPAAEYHSR